MASATFQRPSKDGQGELQRLQRWDFIRQQAQRLLLLDASNLAGGYGI